MPLSPSDECLDSEAGALPAEQATPPTTVTIALRSCDLGPLIATGAGWLVAPWWPVGGALLLVCRADLSADERNEARDAAGVGVPHLRMVAVEHWQTVASWFDSPPAGDVPDAPQVAALSPARPEPPVSAPVTSWAGVARAAGVSLDTLSRRRKAWGFADPRPYFGSVDEAKAWYRKGEQGRHHRPPGTTAKQPSRRPAPSTFGTAGTTLADLEAERAAKGSRGRRSR